MKNNKFILKDILLAIIFGFAFGAVIAIFSHGNFWFGWLGAILLNALLAFAAIRIWRTLNPDKTLALIMLITFCVRIILGIFLYQALPKYGYDSPVQQAGYVFSDAYERDQAAYQIAKDTSILFEHDLDDFWAVDQYGGLLAVSTLIYKFLSPDIHRPLLMVVISAFSMAIGVFFLFTAVTRKWGRKVALVAAWVLALYPDGILLGSSQMREPILIGLSCLLFWSCLNWKEKPIHTLITGLLITGITCAFSIPVACAALSIISGMIFFEWFSLHTVRKTRLIGLSLFVFVLALVGVAGWIWLRSGLSYEYYLTESGSGWITYLIDQYGAQYKIPFITFYGLTQPLLPAAIIDPSLPLWRGIAIFRALGWYLILSFLLYSFFAAVKSTKEKNRGILIFLSLAIAAWVLISSVRGGGDQWDNPRYRTTFIPWMAILIGWVWQRLQTQKRPWFWRFVAIEVVFVLFFLNWYINRQINIGTSIPFPIMIVLIFGISFVIVTGGFVFDLIKNRRKSPAIGRS